VRGTNASPPLSEETNVFWSLPVRGTNVFFVPPGGGDAKNNSLALLAS